MEAVCRFQSDYVILNYDFGNVLINSRGEVDPAADFDLIVDRVGHLHLKDAILRDAQWEWAAIGQGKIDYPRIFTRLQQLSRVIPTTLDLPLSLVLDRQARAGMVKEPMRLEEIDRIMLASLEFVCRY